jgi:hypothetical protein
MRLWLNDGTRRLQQTRLACLPGKHCIAYDPLLLLRLVAPQDKRHGGRG